MTSKLFDDFEQRFGPKSIADIVFADQSYRDLINDLVTGVRPFPITEGKCGILLYGIPGTGKSALAKLLPDAMETARGGVAACMKYERVQPGNNGMTMLGNLASQAMQVPFWAKYHYFVLDEVDGLNDQAMLMLKSVMNYSDTVWVMTTNNFSKIESGIKSRCHCIPFNAAPAQGWFSLAHRILAHAGVAGVTDAQLEAIIEPCQGSAREVIDAIVDLALTTQRNNAVKKIVPIINVKK